MYGALAGNQPAHFDHGDHGLRTVRDRLSRAISRNRAVPIARAVHHDPDAAICDIRKPLVIAVGLTFDAGKLHYATYVE